MGEQAVALAKAVKYQSAGTVEFGVGKDQSFYFLEMNTRLQVEHPVTEMTSGIDIVEQQLRVARGERLALTQADVACRGHAFELRINAEHPQTFAPSPGVITEWHMPEGDGIRVDTHAHAGYRVPSHYDSLVAKLIVHGATRDLALQRARAALDEMRIGGIHTNVPLHRRLLDDAGVVTGGVDIHHLERLLRQGSGKARA